MQRRCRCLREELPVGFVGAGFETADHGTEVVLHGLLYEKDAVQVVRHDLQGDGRDLRVMGLHGKPLLLHPLP